MEIKTPSEFIESGPLYTIIPMRDFRPPESITRMCTHVTCRRETTWLKRAMLNLIFENTPPEALTSKAVAYVCGLCRSTSTAVYYQLLDWKQSGGPNSYSHHAVRKVGQIPQPDISIPQELETRLGTSASHYKKALICRENSYGIAAMAYLRRVVDEKTDELIDVMADLSRTHQVDEEEVVKLLAAKTSVRYEQKLEVAAELIPVAVRPAGVNPLGQLYKHTSIGLHGKTDDECIAIFDDLKQDFEYIFRNLHLQAKERREFALRVQQRAGGGVKKAEPEKEG